MPLMLASCNPQPNWIPRNPKLMFHLPEAHARFLHCYSSSVLVIDGRFYEIPPTEVGGLFRSNLQESTDRVLESHQRKLVDCSDPASEIKRQRIFKSDFRFMRFLCGRKGWI